MHSLPVLMNIVSNLLLGSLNVTETIQIWSNPLIQVSSSQKIILEQWGRGQSIPGWEGAVQKHPTNQGKSWLGLSAGFRRM